MAGGDGRRARRLRWLILLVPASIYFVSYFHRVAPAVVAADLMRAFSITAATLGNLAAIYPYVFAAMALVAGSLADTLGARWTLTLGAATMGAGAGLFGLAPTFELAYGARLLVGLGASVILIAWLALAAEWFRPHEFATVSGFTQSVGNVGALMASGPLALLVEAVGWRTAFVTIGAATLVVGLGSFLFVRDRPEALGLPRMDGVRPARPAPTLGEIVRGIPDILANPRTWPPVLAAGGVYASLIAFLGLWAVPYLTQVYGLTRVEAANRAALLAVGMGIGSPLAGWLSDRWLERRRLPMAACFAVYALCWAALVVPAGPRLPVGAIAPIFFVMGFASSALVLVWSCVREVNNPERVGIAVGFCNMPIFLGIALLQWLMGTILDAGWTGLGAEGARVYPAAAYRAAFGACLAAAGTSFVMACLVTETRCRNVWRPR